MVADGFSIGVQPSSHQVLVVCFVIITFLTSLLQSMSSHSCFPSDRSDIPHSLSVFLSFLSFLLPLFFLSFAFLSSQPRITLSLIGLDYHHHRHHFSISSNLFHPTPTLFPFYLSTCSHWLSSIIQFNQHLVFILHPIS